MAAGKKQIYVSSGTYNERVLLSNGISLYGGYNSASGWARSPGNLTLINGTVVSGTSIAIQGTNIINPTTIDRFTITSPSASGTTNGNWKQ
ncbi:MAG: hypothetical protein IPN56_15950 [Chitinophagaceae bacterium]|nr:hypothetical protein [Chitinophagaceae bacterium]